MRTFAVLGFRELGGEHCRVVARLPQLSCGVSQVPAMFPLRAPQVFLEFVAAGLYLW